MFSFFRSILFLMTMISSRRSPIFDGDGLSTEGSCVLKTTKCFMIHGCVSYCDCVVHVNG